MKKITLLQFILLFFSINTVYASPPSTPVLKLEINQFQANASWTAVKDAVGYNLYYAPSFETKYVKKIELGQQTSLSATLEAGDAYYIAVTAYNAQREESLYSNIEHFIIDPNKKAVELPVFPNAQGFGVNTTAGRGAPDLPKTTICQVLNLNDSGAGSFRECLEAINPRIVIFKTGGTITLARPIVITQPYISIFGQTAPGDGIMITLDPSIDNAPIIIATHDVLMQHMRIRLGSANIWTRHRDALSLRPESDQKIYNVVLDHNSISWASDELIDAWSNVERLTISNNILAEGLKNNTSLKTSSGNSTHLGGEGVTGNISFHHNLITHTYQRGPAVQTSIGITDIISNINYGWLSRGTSISNQNGVVKANVLDNLYIRNIDTQYQWGDIIIDSSNETRDISIYFKNNFTLGLGFEETVESSTGRRLATDPEYLIATEGWGENYNPDRKWHTSTRHPSSFISRTLAGDLEERSLKAVGASLPKRDVVDTRIIQQVKTRTGTMKNCVTPNDPIPLATPVSQCTTSAYEAQWPEYNEGTPYLDRDNDGVDDEWEKENGLTVGLDDALLDNNQDGYLNIENWVFSLSH